MSRLRSLSLVFALGAAVALVFGSAGVTGVVADRGVQVSVVDDEHAYVGFDAHQINPNKATVKVANRYLHDLEVTVTAESTVSKTVRVGKEKSFSVEVSCMSDQQSLQPVVVSAIVAGTGAEFATLDRTIEVPPCADSDDADADGSDSDS